VNRPLKNENKTIVRPKFFSRYDGDVNVDTQQDNDRRTRDRGGIHEREWVDMESLTFDRKPLSVSG
jgi:hypothetical protein